jgi:hypothetical protein
LEPDITAEKLKEMIAEVKKEIKNLESELQGSSNAIPISLTGFDLIEKPIDFNKFCWLIVIFFKKRF